MNFDPDKTFSYPLFHAYLLEGDEKTLKEAVTELSLRIFCEKKPPCKKCERCQKVLTENHSDIRIIDGDTKVEDLRKALSDLYYTSSDGGAKIYLFPNADGLSEYSQNVLLLPIEEPPEGVYFIICCKSSEKILPTVKSRCRHLFFGGDDDIKNDLEEACKNFVSLLFRNDEAEILMLFNYKKEEKDKFSDFINYFAPYCRRKALYFSKNGEFSEAEKYIALCSCGEKWARKTELNLNITLTVTGFLFDCYRALK